MNDKTLQMNIYEVKERLQPEPVWNMKCEGTDYYICIAHPTVCWRRGNMHNIFTPSLPRNLVNLFSWVLWLRAFCHQPDHNVSQNIFTIFDIFSDWELTTPGIVPSVVLFWLMTPFVPCYNPPGTGQENQFASFIFVRSIDLYLPLMICTGAIKNRCVKPSQVRRFV